MPAYTEIDMTASQKWAVLKHLFYKFLFRVHNNTCNDNHKATRGVGEDFIFIAKHTKGDFSF